eukprot:gene25636-30965_t
MSISAQHLTEAIQSMKRYSACGRSGLRVNHLRQMLPKNAALSESLLALVNLLAAGKAPTILAPIISSAPLTPVLKKDGGVRPVAAANYLQPFQLGIAVSNAPEAILHGLNRLTKLEGFNGIIALLDFSNALTVLAESTSLLMKSGPWSVTAFLDDASLALPPSLPLLVKVFDYITEEGPPRGLYLNPLKSLFFSPFRPSLSFSAAISSHTGIPWSTASGVELLGGALFTDMSFHEAVAMKKATKWMTKLIYTFRVTPPAALVAPSNLITDSLMVIMRHIVGMGLCAKFSDFQLQIASLPPRFGGLGITIPHDACTFAFAPLRLKRKAAKLADLSSHECLQRFGYAPGHISSSPHPPAFLFNPTPPCVYAPQGYQADSYLYSLASTLMLSYPIISNGRDGNQSTFHQDHVEMLHKNAFRQQRVFINEMLSGKVKLPSYVIAAQLCHCSPNRRPCQLPGG